MKVTITGSNMTAKIASLMFALVLWLGVSLNAPFTYKVDLPIKYIGPSEGFIVTGQYPGRILVLIEGSGKSLLPFSLMRMRDPGKYYALVYLTGLTKGKHQIELDKTNINVSDDGSLEVQSILDKAFFPIEIDRVITRNIPVNTDSLPPYQLEKGYVIVGKPRVRPRFIVVQGPEDTLAVIKSVRIVSLEHNKISLKDTVLKASVGTEFGNLVTLNPEAVELSFTFEPLAQKVFVNIPLTLKSFPRKNLPDFTPESFSVDVKGPESIVSKLKPDDILVTIRYQTYLELSAQGEKIVRPEIISPEGLDVTLIPEFVRFTVNAAKG